MLWLSPFEDRCRIDLRKPSPIAMSHKPGGPKMHALHHPRRHDGITLIELIIAIAIFAIMTSLAAPTYSKIAAQNRHTTSVNHLLYGVLAARQIAISQNTPVTFCAGNIETGCTGDWDQHHWIVFTDKNRSTTVDSGDQVLLDEQLELLPETHLSVNGPFRKAVIFQPTGFAEWPSGAFAAGRIRICTPHAKPLNTTDLVTIGSGRTVAESRNFTNECIAA